MLGLNLWAITVILESSHLRIAYVIEAAMPTPQSYRSVSQLVILIVLSASSCVCAKSTNENEEGAPFNRTTLAHHYFFHEIDFLAKQSMILGNYHGYVDKSTSSGNAEERIDRLRFLEKSLLVELEYIQQLMDMSKNPDEILHNVNATECYGDVTMGCSYDEMRYQQDTPRDNVIANVVSRASWPALVPQRTPKNTPPQTKSIYQIDHKYNFDRAMKRGFGRMYDDLNCYDHATDQNKPMYTPEMWRKLWEIFRDSTLFPFPIPNDDECPEEPSYAAHTTDGKGRGIFASRNITEGSLVHPGHPNTVFFLDSTSWHRFVSSLPKMFACGKCTVLF